MSKINLTCIKCPSGCQIEVEVQDKKVISVTGNKCDNGEKYASQEAVAPVRTLTSLVLVKDGAIRVASVKTNKDIPKEKIMDVMEEVKRATAVAPVTIGQVIIPNVCGTGADIIATKNVAKKFA